MAVVITTKFYEEATPAWHDLAKVVFTSPNMDSPNTAGTRSHILPGQLDLGMWYEDASNMYRVEDKQEMDSSTYFGYSAKVHDQFDLDSPPLYITIDQTDQTDWIEYIRERVDVSGNSWPMKYNLVSGNHGYISFDGCTFSGGIYRDGNVAWAYSEEEEIEGTITFSAPLFYLTELEYSCNQEAVASIFPFRGDGNTIKISGRSIDDYVLCHQYYLLVIDHHSPIDKIQLLMIRL